MPMHPSNTYTIHELQANAADILHAGTGRGQQADQGCQDEPGQQVPRWRCLGGSGRDRRLRRRHVRQHLRRCRHPARQELRQRCLYPEHLPGLHAGSGRAASSNGRASDLVDAGAIMRECFCGPCFGAGDCPANGEFSIRHTTRNFPNREGSKPGEGQMSPAWR